MNAALRGPRNLPAPMLPPRQPRDLLFKAAASVLRAHVGQTTVEQAAGALYSKDPSFEVIKSVSTQATTTNLPWAGVIAHAIVSDLLQQITALSAAAALMRECVSVSLAGVASVTIPGRLRDPQAAGDWVGEGQAIPVRSPLLTAGPTLMPRKLAVLSGFTAEMVMSSNIEMFTRVAITEATAALLDLRMFSSTPGDANGPAGILIGATTVPASTATAGWAISSDVGALVQALADNGGGLSPVFIAAPAQASALKMWTDYSDVYPSSALAAGTVIAIEKSSFVSAVDAAPTFAVADGIQIVESDTAPPVDESTASHVKSYFQIDAISLKMVMHATWGLRNSTHVAVMTGTTW